MEDLENQGRTPKRRTLDLSLTQVAASALAAVVGAVLASQLGVYGTILGAAVVSIGATTGTAVLQHVFRRTGEQLREMTTTNGVIEHRQPEAETAGTEEPQVFDPFDPGGDHTRMMARINPPDQGEAVAVYRGRSNLKPKSWKVYAVTATTVFALAMGTVGVIELASGKPAANLFDGSGGGGGKPSGGTSAPVDPSPHASADRTGAGGSGSTSGTGGQGGGGKASPDPGASSSPHPSTSPSTDSATPTPTPHTSTGGAATTGTSGDAASPQSTPSP